MRNGKRVLTCMLAVAMAVGTAGAGGEWGIWGDTRAVAQAAEADENGFVIEDGVLTKYTGKGGDVVIPSEVEEIGCDAFAGKNRLKRVVIPSGVKVIGDRAFDDCSNLVSVVISDGVKEIGDSAFRDCGWLKNIKIPGSVKNIGSAAFFCCSGLTGLNISEGVRSIGSLAFFACDSLIDIVIPSSVENIGGGAFAVGSAYSMHRKLKQIQVDNGNQKYKSVDGILFSKDGKELLQYPSGKNSLESQDNMSEQYTIPYGVITIGEYAFSHCRFVNVMIPNSVTTIGNRAFYDCDVISSITIPASVTSIGEEAFAACWDLKEILVDESNINYASVDGVLFSKDKRILVQFPTGKNRAHDTENSMPTQEYRYSIPFGVREIYAGAFDNSGLTEIKIPESVTSIGENDFLGNNENFTIYCVKGSYAHTYAVNNNYRYKFMEGSAKLQGNLKLKKSNIVLKEGQKSQIKITSKLNTKATYKSLNTSIATVSKKGAVIGKKRGKTTIVVSANGKKKKVKVTVKADPSVVVFDKGLKLSKKNITAKKGKKITIKRESGVMGEVTFKALDEKIIRVTAKGVVKAKKRGRTSVVIKMGRKTAKLKVTVKR